MKFLISYVEVHFLSQRKMFLQKIFVSLLDYVQQHQRLADKKAVLGKNHLVKTDLVSFRLM